MRRADSPEEGDAARSPPSLLFLSFFEQECRDIVARLLHPAEPSPLPPDRSALRLESAGFVTSTPLSDSAPGNDVAPDSAPAAGACPRSPGPEAAAAPTPARGEPQCLPQRAAGSRPARPQALPRRTAQRGAAQQLYGRQGPQTRTSGRGGRQSLSQAWASPGLELPRAGKGLGAPGSRLLQPAGAARAGALRQPARRLSTAVRALASRSRLQPLGKEPSPKRFRGSTVKEQLCNMTQELMKNDESKEWLVGTAVGAGTPLELTRLLAAENQASCDDGTVRRVCISALGSGGFSPCVEIKLTRRGCIGSPLFVARCSLAQPQGVRMQSLLSSLQVIGCLRS
ncbi:uncharacterized protein AAGF69_007537 isoform 4-T5 [Amazona ochrocephala]